VSVLNGTVREQIYVTLVFGCAFLCVRWFEMCSSHLAGVCTDSYSVYVNMCTVYYELSVGGGYRKQGV